MLFSWLRQRLRRRSHSAGPSSGKASRPARSCRLSIDVLEDRAMPSASVGAGAAGLGEAQRYVSQLYRDLLQREVDSSGLAFWSGRLEEGASRAQVVGEIMTSPEYHTRLIENLYATLLGRSAEAAGLSGWVGLLDSGITEETVRAAILGSEEYWQRAGGSGAGFVQALCQDVLGHEAGPADAAAFVRLLARGKAPAAVARDVLRSEEGRDAQVQGHYQRLLHRAADPDGLRGFVSALQRGAGDPEVLAGFLASDEYFTRAVAGKEGEAASPNDLKPADEVATGPDARPDAPREVGADVPVIEQWRGRPSSGETIRQRLVIRTAEQWQEVWAKANSSSSPRAPAPDVDFSKHMVLAVFMGEKPNSGYRIDITRVVQTEKGLAVHVLESDLTKEPNTGYLTALTVPFHFVVVPRVDGEVVFVDATNLGPTATILAPEPGAGSSDLTLVADGFDEARGLLYKDVTLRGQGIDPEDGELPGTALSWHTGLGQHFDTARRLMMPLQLGTGKEVTVRLYSDDPAGVWHEIELEATDRFGRKGLAVIRVFLRGSA